MGGRQLAMSTRPAIDIHELGAMLRDRAGELAPELLPNGVRRGNLWRASGIADTGQSESLGVNLSGPRIGIWTDWGVAKGSPEHSGDMLSLAALVKFGGELKRAIPWARAYLGLDALDPRQFATERAKVAQRAAGRDNEAKRRAEWMRRHAISLFIDPRAVVPIVDTPAELYLAGRGIDLSVLGRVSRSLGYHPAVRCTEAGNAELPAMIARVIDGSGRQIATHRTWIEPAPGGLWRKASLAEPKKAMGAVVGGYIPLSKGGQEMTLQKIPAGTPIAVSEGIEDGMTVACACPELRVIAAVWLSNMANLPIPPQAGRVTIIGQNDAPGSDADNTLRKVVATLSGRGLEVAIARPPSGVKDANDLAGGELVGEQMGAA